jgi:hypothetical protein
MSKVTLLNMVSDAWRVVGKRHEERGNIPGRAITHNRMMI